MITVLLESTTVECLAVSVARGFSSRAPCASTAPSRNLRQKRRGQIRECGVRVRMALLLQLLKGRRGKICLVQG